MEIDSIKSDYNDIVDILLVLESMELNWHKNYIDTNKQKYKMYYISIVPIKFNRWKYGNISMKIGK